MTDEPTVNALTKFQIDLLSVLVAEPRSGARAQEALEQQYGRDIPHGRVYQNLSKLHEMGFVHKREREISDRTNLYEATEAGIIAAREYASTLYTRVESLAPTYRRHQPALDG